MADDSSDYYLAVSKGQKFTGIRPLTEDEYNESIRDILGLKKHEGSNLLFDVVESNFEDFINKIEYYKEEYRKNSLMLNLNSSLIYFDLNRLILNILSAIRTFLDHTERRLQKTYGQSSNELFFFKKERNNAFDNNFAYRFTEKLRNYSQHCGLPLGNIEFSSYLDGDDTIYNILISVDSLELLEDYDSWGEVVKKELGEIDGKFDLLPLIQEKYEVLKGIGSRLYAIEEEYHRHAAEQLLDLILETIETKERPIIMKLNGDGEKLQMQIHQFPFNAISRLTGVKIEEKSPTG